ncbi:hypothetical protein CICLE_v10007309mg [Citrus x clementina]|uniref:Protein kinase domain-containing protein n=1 Tax=Citrus clementina TaxID=85681 RepID=V4TVY3_CITCL|nr:hypothetical protein CICLE_v10007309mg [Citrus x clementina]
MAPPPSLIPTNPVASPPSITAPPPVNMAPPPSLIPTTPVASPPPITAPPLVNVLPAPSLIPTTPLASPLSSKAFPPASPPSNAARPPASHPSNTARPPASHPSRTAPPPASHPSNTALPSKTAPSPASHPSNTALPPASLPSKTAPPPASHLSNTAPPPASHPYKTSPLPASHPSKTAPPPASHPSNTAPPPASHPSKTAPPPASHPSNTAPPPASHPSKTAPPPASHPSNTAPPPASHPSKTAPPPASHPSKTAPPPASHPSNTAPPPASHPSNTAPPPASHPSNTAPLPASHPSNTALPPASHPSNTAPPPASHPSNTALPPASHPSNTALPPASHPSNPAIPPASHPSNTAIPPASHPSNTAPPHASHPSNTALTPASHPSNIAPPPLFVPVLPSALPGKAPVSQSPISLPDAPDCSTTICTEPYTNTPPGSPCGCVWPMQVGLRLSVALYTFFPLVSELAGEIAAGVFMKQSQVRIIGANAAEQPDKTVVLTDLVPLGEKFDNTTAFLTYQRFWHKQVVIKSSYFGDYEVLYVRYPGLPPSPPSASSSIGIIDDGPYSGNNGRATKPEGVDVPKRRQKYGLSGGMIAIVVLSAFVAVVLCSAVAWVLLFKYKTLKFSGAAGLMVGSGLDSASLSFGSSIATYTGSAKTFSASEIEKATGNFDASRILGEGGFGLVYSGVLDDGTKVAVKVLKRVDQQGGREFLAEVEMLSRLHHRNLVKLIGICIEEQARCLVYELIPNGSVESHLHGVDKESAPLGWDARLKIALGAARALAYLHEDSSPRVIHRDFKSSNILLEHDFTPKVSDFGLARSAMDEESRHISTRVMGTFGYVAPEYAMTGHLLVKSDVYSYGVVILELLSGRKPVDMTQPPGQENLVAWARPLLTSREGLERIIDPSLGSDVPFDSVAKVAAIASMCVQPEVQHRPFMGEVVQALKLVCNECDEAKEVGSASSSQDDMSIDLDSKVSTGSGQLPDPLQRHYSVPNYDLGLDTGRRLSLSYLFSSSARSGKEESELFRRYSSSGPLRTGRGRQFWQRIRRLVGGSDSEHGAVFSLWPGSY